MGFGLELLGAVVLFAACWWIGWRAYLYFLSRRGMTRKCPHCGHYIKNNPTYCPNCGEVVSRWSSRR